MGSCATIDYLATVAVVLLMLFIYFRMAQMYLSPPVRVLTTLFTGVFVADYIYTSYLVGVVSNEFVNWLVGFLALLVVFIMTFYINSEILVIGVLVALSLYGYPWYIVTFSSLFVGALFAMFIYYNEQQYLGLLIWDSLFISLNIMIGILAIATNVGREEDIPPTCHGDPTSNSTFAVGHLNMLVICDAHCASVAAMNFDRWALLIAALVLTGVRFLYVYYREVCGQPKDQLAALYKKQHRLQFVEMPPKERSTGCFSCSACCPSWSAEMPFVELPQKEPKGDKNKKQKPSKPKQEETKKNKRKKKQEDDEDSDEDIEMQELQESEIDEADLKARFDVEKQLEDAVAVIPSKQVNEQIANAEAVKPASDPLLQQLENVSASQAVKDELKRRELAIV